MAAEALDSPIHGMCTGAVTRSAGGADTMVVALRGEHDLATVDAVAGAIGQAVRSCRGDVVVDLSDVDFMDGSTIGVLLQNRRLLGERGRSLVVRAPSASAAHVLRLCGIAHLVDPADPQGTSP